MFGLLSVLIGLAALISLFVAFIPLLGWLNWLIIPLAILGAGLGFLAATVRKPDATSACS